MLPPFSLPSNPQIVVNLREAVISEIIDFSDVDEGHEEEATTLFLNQVQPPESFTDSITWTADDRRLALFWYWIHTEKDTETALTYDCGYCGETHTWLLNFKELGNNYTPIKGKPEREFILGIEKVIVRPLIGRDVELLEKTRLALELVGEEKGRDSGAYKKQEAQLKIAELALSVEFVDLKGQGTDKEKREHTENKIMNMSGSLFSEFAGMVAEKLAQMRHGLESEFRDGKIYLLTPPHVCPDDERKENKTRLRVRFWNSDYIPAV